MRTIKEEWRHSITRRSALAGLAGFLAGSPVIRAQDDPWPLERLKRALGLAEMRNVWDFEAVFRENVSTPVYTYTAQSCGTEWTKRRNRRAFEWVEIVPGKQADRTTVDFSTEVYGTKMPLPIMISPSARHGDLHPEGEAGTHQGASGTGTPFIIASGPSVPVEKIAAAGKGPMWFQLYGLRNLEQNRETLDRVQTAGCRAVVITVDQQALRYPRALRLRNLGGRPRQAVSRPASTPAPGPAAYRLTGGRMWMDWRWVDDVRKFLTVPIVIKGIQTAEDARICVEHGAGIMVSNHGGRVCDYGPATLECLPEIVDEVRSRVPVLVDSGFRRGSDIFKALALGADVVCVSRPVRWALGAFGAPGVQRVLELLQDEFVETAAAAGHTRLASINKSAVRVNFS